VPETLSQLRRLPGVGAYTAGAIASIAHGLDEPVVDGNVTRVLCRVFLIAADPRRAGVHKKLWLLARRLIPRGQAGTFNQALMDLGATVCLPRKPQCPACCLRDACRARAAGRQEQLPRKAPRKAIPHYDIAAGVIRKRGWILIGRRPAKGLLGGLWEFPGGKIEPGETPPEALRREIREEVGLRVDVGEFVASIRHAYSHFRITLHVFECRWRAGRPRALGCEAVRWVRPGQLGEFAFPRANRKIVDQLAAAGQGQRGKSRRKE
jgi:A/G-specific adenine glycosylase